MTGRIIRVFPETNCINSHNGLTEIAKKAGIDVASLPENQYLVFINKAQTLVKVLTSSNILAFYHSPKGRITMAAIQNIPYAFMSTEQFDMNRAIEMALEELLERKKNSRVPDSVGKRSVQGPRRKIDKRKPNDSRLHKNASARAAL